MILVVLDGVGPIVGRHIQVGGKSRSKGRAKSPRKRNRNKKKRERAV